MLLSEIILIAESQSAYEFSLKYHGKLMAALCSGSRLFRQGSTITLAVEENMLQTNGQDRHDLITRLHNPNDHIHQFHVLMTEPTLQGYALHDSTRFIVIPTAEEPRASMVVNGDHPSSPDGEGMTAHLNESEFETLEIDESFLATGLISSIPLVTGVVTANGGSHNLSQEEYKLRSPTLPDPRRLFSGSPSLTFQLVPFSAPIPYSPEPFDAECCVILRTSDLGRIGLFNGDWVRLNGHKPFMMRRFTTMMFDSFRV